MRHVCAFLFVVLAGFHLKAQISPSVNFAVSIEPNTTNVKFANTSKNLGEGIKKAFWTFSDGATTLTGPYEGTIHRYAGPGTYQSCLKIYRYSPSSTDSVLLGSECKTVSVPAPVSMAACSAGFTFQPITAKPLGRRFVAQPLHSNQKKPRRICWKFGDGKEACMEYTATYTGDYWVDHSYTDYGRYEVCVTIQYDGGCESRKCSLVEIAPVTPATACEAAINEAPSTVSNLERKFFLGLQSAKPAQKVCWKFGDGTDTCIVFASPLNPQQLMVSHRYATPGNYNVCIRVVYDGGCVAERCKSIEIRLPQNNLCGGYFADSVVSGGTFRFRATGVQSPADYVSSYVWTFGDGTTANGQQVNHTFSTPGNYSVCLAMKTNAGCETRICRRVTVAGNVQPQLVLTPNPATSALTASFQSLFQQPVAVKIYNGNGILVQSFSRNATVGSNQWTFDVTGLQTGVYSMIVQSSLQFATAIFLKQ